MASRLICYFIVILFYIEWKLLLMRIRTNSFSHNLTLEVKIVMKISAFQWKNWKIEMKNKKLKMKNCKTFCKHQTACRLKEVIQQIKAYYVSGTTFSLGDMQKYTDICFQSALQCQCFFLTPTWYLLQNL